MHKRSDTLRAFLLQNFGIDKNSCHFFSKKAKKVLTVAGIRCKIQIKIKSMVNQFVSEIKLIIVNM